MRLRLTDYNYAEMCQGVYRNKPYPDWFKPYGIETIELDCDKTHTEGYCAVMDDRLVFAIEGTADFFDVMIDMCAWKVTVGHYCGKRRRVAWGFDRCARSIFPQIRRIVEMHPRKRIVGIGHSLGAVVVTRAIDLLSERYVSEYKLRLWGSPNLGNKAYADELNNRIHDSVQWVGTRDIVPKVPPINVKDVGNMFIHVDCCHGIERYMRAMGSIKEPPVALPS